MTGTARRSVGLVGLGNQGRHYTDRLVEAGYRLTVFDLDAARVQRAVEAGAVAAASVAALVGGCEVVMLALPGSPAVEAVMLGPDGAIAHLRPGQIVIDTGTSRPASHLALCALVERAGARMLDAPVTWRRQGLTVMVGGDEAAFRASEDVLVAIGAKVRYVGSAGQGQMVKLVNQMIQAGTTAIVAEALTFAAKAGVDLDQVVETLDVAGGAQTMLRRAFAGGGHLRLHYKDLTYALEAAQALETPTPITAFLHEVFKSVARDGDPLWTQPAIVTHWERQAGVEVRGREGLSSG
jgi:2-hydroxy-3-oxopropionate reductase